MYNNINWIEREAITIIYTSASWDSNAVSILIKGISVSYLSISQR